MPFTALTPYTVANTSAYTCHGAEERRPLRLLLLPSGRACAEAGSTCSAVFIHAFSLAVVEENLAQRCRVGPVEATQGVVHAPKTCRRRTAVASVASSS